MRLRLTTALTCGLLLAASGCGLAPATPLGSQPGSLRAAATRPLAARVLTAEAVPASLLDAVLPRMQAQSDEMSRRRKLDFFTLHGNPVGLELAFAGEKAHVLSLLGTAKTRSDLNIEMRALVGASGLASSANYSGPVTLGLEARPAPSRLNARDGGLGFELMMGLPPSHVVSAYERAMAAQGRHLERRYDAREFELGADVTPFAVLAGGEAVAYVLCDQRNRLVLGDRKYADVQTVTALGLDGAVLAGYTLVGFNEKTTGADAAPRYRVHDDAPVGPIFEFGDYEGRR